VCLLDKLSSGPPQTVSAAPANYTSAQSPPLPQCPVGRSCLSGASGMGARCCATPRNRRWLLWRTQVNPGAGVHECPQVPARLGTARIRSSDPALQRLTVPLLPTTLSPTPVLRRLHLQPQPNSLPRRPCQEAGMPMPHSCDSLPHSEGTAACHQVLLRLQCGAAHPVPSQQCSKQAATLCLPQRLYSADCQQQ
jgi:hypothetical protein